MRAYAELGKIKKNLRNAKYEKKAKYATLPHASISTL